MKNINLIFYTKRKIFIFLLIKIICLFSYTNSITNSNTLKEDMSNKLQNKSKAEKLLLKKTNLNLKLNSKTFSRSKMLSIKSLTFSNTNVNNEKVFQEIPKVTVDLKNTADIGKGPIYFQGWNKYFILKNSKNFEMKDFNYNDAYNKEQRDNFMKKHKDDYELSIPNELSFYFILTDEYFTSISSRHVKK